MAAELFDYAELLRPDLPPAAAKWTGFPKFNFVGGHNDAGIACSPDEILITSGSLQGLDLVNQVLLSPAGR